jgi:hypothetical protein
MDTKYIESGTDATQGFQFWASTTTSNNGAVTSDTAQVRTGPRSIKTNSGTPVAGNAYVATADGLIGAAGQRISFGFRAASFSVLGQGKFLELGRAATLGHVVTLNQLSGGALTLRDEAGTILATGSTLSAATWYRITFSYTITDVTTNEFRVYLDDSTTAALTATNVTLLDADPSNLRLGIKETLTLSIIYNFDDIYVDDGTTLDNISTTDLKVTVKLPATENTTSFDTAIGAARGASDFNSVNERPLSETNGWRHNAISDVQENYGLQAVGAGDVDITGKTLIARTAWIWAKASTLTGPGTPGIVDNGSVTAIVLATTSKLFTVITDSATYPSNAAGIGMRSSNAAADVFFYEGGTLIAYKDAVADTLFAQAML